ncbi:MAG: carbohydrate kinase family protein [Candidatus Micrarchaeota archaeon]|nr:carbohydrate kinase family protein [Candidatus Micrarchaeota archaeon]
MGTADGDYTIYSVGHVAYDSLFYVDRLPKKNASCYILDSGTYFGGGAGNFAYVCSKLGGKVSLVSCAGEDFVSGGYAKRLAKAGVGIKNVRVIEGTKSAHAFMFSDKKGEMLSFFSWGAAKKFGGMKVPQIRAGKGDIIHIATGNPDFNVRMSKIGNISFDPGYDVGLYGRSSLEGILRNTRFLFGNEHEFGAMKATLRNDDFFDYGVEYVVVTKGAKGSEVMTKNGRITVPTIKTKIVDTIGAGDAYKAGFLCAFAKGRRIEECARIGSSVASFVLQGRGGQEKAPGWKDALKRAKLL